MHKTLMPYFLSFILFIFVLPVSAQNDKKREKKENEPQTQVAIEWIAPPEVDIVSECAPGEMPLFGDGSEFAFQRWMAGKIQYPLVLAEAGVQGRVMVRFVVDTDGSVTSPQVVSSPHPLLSQEALRVIRLSPKWVPAEREGRAVRDTMNFPVVFRLQ